jgi:hypothetical protein
MLRWGQKAVVVVVIQQVKRVNRPRGNSPSVLIFEIGGNTVKRAVYVGWMLVVACWQWAMMGMDGGWMEDINSDDICQKDLNESGARQESLSYR